MVSISTYNWDLSDPNMNLNLLLSTNWVPILHIPLFKAYHIHGRASRHSGTQHSFPNLLVLLGSSSW